MPIGGKTYTIPPVSIATGLLLRNAVIGDDAKALEELAGNSEEDGYRRILGDAYDEMKADGVPWDALDRAYLTAVTDHQRGRIIAEVVWEVGHDPKATMALISAGARIATGGVGAEHSTLRPDSGKRTTTSRDARTKRKKKAPVRSRGRK